MERRAAEGGDRRVLRVRQARHGDTDGQPDKCANDGCADDKVADGGWSDLGADGEPIGEPVGGADESNLEPECKPEQQPDDEGTYHSRADMVAHEQPDDGSADDGEPHGEPHVKPDGENECKSHQGEVCRQAVQGRVRGLRCVRDEEVVHQKRHGGYRMEIRVGHAGLEGGDRVLCVRRRPYQKDGPL